MTDGAHGERAAEDEDVSQRQWKPPAGLELAGGARPGAHKGSMKGP